MPIGEGGMYVLKIRLWSTSFFFQIPQHLVAVDDLYAPKSSVPKFNEINDVCFPKPWTSHILCQKLRRFPSQKNAEFPPLRRHDLQTPSSSRMVVCVERKLLFQRVHDVRESGHRIFLLKVESKQIQRLGDVDSQLDAARIDQPIQTLWFQSKEVSHKFTKSMGTTQVPSWFEMPGGSLALRQGPIEEIGHASTATMQADVTCKDGCMDINNRILYVKCTEDGWIDTSADWVGRECSIMKNYMIGCSWRAPHTAWRDLGHRLMTFSSCSLIPYNLTRGVALVHCKCQSTAGRNSNRKEQALYRTGNGISLISPRGDFGEKSILPNLENLREFSNFKAQLAIASKSGSLSMFARHVFPVSQVFQCQKFFLILKEHSGYWALAVCYPSI